MSFTIVLKKPWQEGAVPIVRIQSACTFGHVFGSAKCNCGPQLEEALARIATEGGVLVYALHQDGRGASVVGHANAYALQQEQGLDTVESYERLGLDLDSRDYSNAAKIILHHCGISDARVITSNPRKIEALEQKGIRITETIPALIPWERLNRWRASQFIAAADKMGHVMPAVFLERARRKLGVT